MARAVGQPTQKEQRYLGGLAHDRGPLPATAVALLDTRCLHLPREALTAASLLTADSVSTHHEFRKQPLPAWAVHSGDEEGATAYVPAELGQVLRIRNDRWRVFDFLWMLHTMDYQRRDNFNNLALRALSVLGLVTVASGLLLFGLTSPTIRRHRAVTVGDTFRQKSAFELASHQA